MQQNDFSRFTRAYGAMEKAWEIEAGPERIKIAFMALRDVPIEAVEQGIWHIIGHRTTATKLPTPGEIREGAMGSAEDAATVALAKLEGAMREYDLYMSVIFDDPVIHRVVASYAGGWIGICELSRTDEWRFARQEFIKKYRAFADMPQMETPTKLIGWNEASNEEANTTVPERIRKQWTVTVGDRVKALEWSGKAQAALEGGNEQLGELVKAIGR